MTMIRFDISKADAEFVELIIERAVNMDLVPAPKGTTAYKEARTAMTMDLVACHLNGCPLDLAALSEAPAFDFGHDVLGISRHMNRRTGALAPYFCPRYARRERVVS